MYKFGYSYRRLSIWILIFVQVLVIFSYFYLQMDKFIQEEFRNDKIKFLATSSKITKYEVSYHTIDSKIILPLVNTSKSFINFNSSLCYINGTDLVIMNRSKTVNWKCECLPGWHGSDCGQPEVIWRTTLTHHKHVSIKGPKLYERRIIYLMRVNELTESITDIRINELGHVVDLFVLYENENSNILQSKLYNQFNEGYHEKILYLKSSSLANLWQSIRKCIKNLRHDDLVLMSNNNEIHNKLVLQFLKNYDGWTQPIFFRMRWSVYGFFWKHPQKTVIVGGASTVSYLKNISTHNLEALAEKHQHTSLPIYKGIIFGDLNHYGGWYCEYCNEPLKIVRTLTEQGGSKVLWDRINRAKIDETYIEELIENGVYIDGTTELERARKYRDTYFGPAYVMNNNKYDFLMTNFYSKMDYYEG